MISDSFSLLSEAMTEYLYANKVHICIPVLLNKVQKMYTKFISALK